MNREQKAAAIAEIAQEIESAEAIFAVDYRGISVPQAAELRVKLRDAEASFRVVKNSLTERAADQSGAETLKELLAGPTALTFVRGDAALAAKAVADYARATSLLPFKGGVMGGEALSAAQIGQIARLPARDVLYGQLVGIVASPIGGLVRTLNALLGGLAIALGQVAEKKGTGEIPGGEAPAAAEAAAGPSAEPPADEPAPSEGGSPSGGSTDAPETAPRTDGQGEGEGDGQDEGEGDQDASHSPPPEQPPSQAEGDDDESAQPADETAAAAPAEVAEEPADATETKTETDNQEDN